MTRTAARETVRTRLTAAVAGSFLVPVTTSTRATMWIAGYRALQVPRTTVGTAHRYRIALGTEEVAVVCIGRKELFRRFLRRVLGGGAPVEQASSRRPLWNPDRLWSENAALVAVELNPALAKRFRAAGWLVCPQLVRWQGSLAHMPPVNPSKSLRADLQRVKRQGYVLREAEGSRDDWNEFRRRMLIPYAQQRFGDEASILSPVVLRSLKARGRLFFLTEEGTRVAGLCVICTRGQVWMAALGVQDGDLSLMKQGTLAGLYELTIEWAKANGMHRLDAGRTSAFERDGLARFKRKWGMSPARDPLSNLIAVRVDPAQHAMQLAIEREPFWIENGRGGVELYPGG
jgi:hypothetical protein